MKSFVDNVSSYEGAEVPGEENNDDDDIHFDANKFMDTIQSLLSIYTIFIVCNPY